MEALQALHVPTFRHLAAAYTINELGNWIGDVALAILVFDRTGSPLATATLFLALRFAPALIAPVLTTRIEVISPQRVLPALYLGEAVIFAAIAVVAHRFSLPLVLLLAALDGMLAISARALIRSVNATILGTAGLLRQGNAIINMGVTISSAVGPAVAGLLVAAAGASVALAIDAASFAVVAVILAAARGLRIESDRHATTIGRLRAGLREVWERPVARNLLIATAMAFLFAAAVIPIEVVFAKRTLHAGDSGYGLLIGSWGVGMVVGGAIFAVASQVRLSVVISSGLVLIGAGYAGLAASPDLAIACLFSALGGVGNGLWWIAVVTALQQAVPANVQAAVMAVLESVSQVMPAIGFIIGGAVTAASSPRAAYAVAAGGVALVLIAQAIRSVSQVESRPPTADTT